MRSVIEAGAALRPVHAEESEGETESLCSKGKCPPPPTYTEYRRFSFNVPREVLRDDALMQRLAEAVNEFVHKEQFRRSVECAEHCEDNSSGDCLPTAYCECSASIVVRLRWHVTNSKILFWIEYADEAEGEDVDQAWVRREVAARAQRTTDRLTDSRSNWQVANDREFRRTPPPEDITSALGHGFLRFWSERSEHPGETVHLYTATTCLGSSKCTEKTG